jgi:hypothetical protein
MPVTPGLFLAIAQRGFGNIYELCLGAAAQDEVIWR